MPKPMRSTATVVQIVPNPGGSDVRALRIARGSVGAARTRRSRPRGRLLQRRSSDDVLHSADVRRLQTLVALLDLEFDLLTFLKTAVASHLDGAVMHEHVSPAVRLRDEPVTLLGVEPLDRPGRHLGDPLSSLRTAVSNCTCKPPPVPPTTTARTLAASTLGRQWRTTSSSRPEPSTSNSSRSWPFYRPSPQCLRRRRAPLAKKGGAGSRRPNACPRL